jgi:hypothetical protein
MSALIPQLLCFEGGQEDRVVHVVVSGEGGGEPDWHLFEGEVGVGVVSGGEEVSAVDGESPSLCPLSVRSPDPLYEPNELRFDLGPVVVGDVEPGGLPVVLLESLGADQYGGVVAVVAAAAAAATAAAALVGVRFLCWPRVPRRGVQLRRLGSRPRRLE